MAVPMFDDLFNLRAQISSSDVHLVLNVDPKVNNANNPS